MPITIGEVDSRGGLNPNESRLFFKSTGLDDNAFSVRAFEGQEAISRPFEFRFDLRSDDANIAAGDVIGKKATFFLRDREIHGVVTAFSYQGLTREEHVYRAVLRPRLWTRSLRRDSEIFLQVDARDVIEAALGGLDFSISTSESLPVKEYVVQYNETDLDFLSRTAEHWGLAYRIAQQPGGSDIVEFFSDSTEAPAVADDALPFDAEQTLRGDRAAASVFVETETLLPGRILVKDYNYRDPETALLSETELRRDDFDSLYYEYGTHHGAQDEGDFLAKVRSEEIECRRRVFSGASNWHEMAAGFVFELKGHPRAAFNGRYLITSVQHEGSHSFGGTLEEAEAEGEEYKNTFTCIPAAVRFRPERATPVPRIPGVMTAKVESSGGEYAHVDSDGRYNARMHFDLSERGEAEASAPIRMNQPYSGPGYGMHFPNHANSEIVWACVNGDPDRPVALGTAPNPSNASPVTSSNRAQSVIRTRGENYIVLDDTSGAQDFQIGASHDHTIVVANDESTEIGNNRTEQVAGSHTESIGGDAEISIGGNLKTTVNGDEEALVGGKQELTVGGNQKSLIGGSVTATVGGAVKATIGGSAQAKIAGASKVDLGGPVKVAAGGPAIVTTAGYKHTAGGPIKIVAGTSLQLKCGAASIVLKADGTIKIKGVKVDIEAAAMASLKANAPLLLQSSSLAELKGAIVKIN